MIKQELINGRIELTTVLNRLEIWDEQQRQARSFSEEELNTFKFEDGYKNIMNKP